MCDGENQYLYDVEGRVCAVQLPTVDGIPGGVYRYLYDAEGRRVGKGRATEFTCTGDPSDFTLTNEYVLDTEGEQVSELDGQGDWLHTNVYAGGQLIATYTPPPNAAPSSDAAAYVVHYQLNDWQGTRRMQVDPNGNVEETFQSLPFGDQMAGTPGSVATSADATEHHFTGKERDAESGNDYMFARYYNSATGRFLSPDWSAKVAPVPYAKLDNPQSLNLYSYVLNNPMIHVDADGHVIDDSGLADNKKYQKWKKEYLSHDGAQSQWNALNDHKNLTVHMSWDSKGNSSLTSGYQWDKSGNLSMSVLLQKPGMSAIR